MKKYCPPIRIPDPCDKDSVTACCVRAEKLRRLAVAAGWTGMELHVDGQWVFVLGAPPHLAEDQPDAILMRNLPNPRLPGNRRHRTRPTGLFSDLKIGATYQAIFEREAYRKKNWMTDVEIALEVQANFPDRFSRNLLNVTRWRQTYNRGLLASQWGKSPHRKSKRFGKPLKLPSQTAFRKPTLSEGIGSKTRLIEEVLRAESDARRKKGHSRKLGSRQPVKAKNLKEIRNIFRP